MKSISQLQSWEYTKRKIRKMGSKDALEDFIIKHPENYKNMIKIADSQIDTIECIYRYSEKLGYFKKRYICRKLMTIAKYYFEYSNTLRKLANIRNKIMREGL